MLPVVSVVALSLGFIVGGAILVETVFNWPGIGLAVYQAVLHRDYPMLQGAFLLLTCRWCSATCWPTCCTCGSTQDQLMFPEVAPNAVEPVASPIPAEPEAAELVTGKRASTSSLRSWPARSGTARRP